MSTDRQKSFIATLGVNNRQLHFLDALYDEPVYVATRFSGGIYTGRPQKIDHSHFLALRSNTSASPTSLLMLYFRHTRYGYTLYIRAPGRHYGKFLRLDENLIGAFPSDKAATFHLLNSNCDIINLEDIKKDTQTVFLQAKNSGLIHARNAHKSKHTYIADEGGIPLSFNLNILERNAPYINHPDEV